MSRSTSFLPKCWTRFQLCLDRWSFDMLDMLSRTPSLHFFLLDGFEGRAIINTNCGASWLCNVLWKRRGRRSNQKHPYAWVVR